ncbi:MAG TPA: DUF6298 domain-containing protein [Opitutaceae bacterium]|nr:DUF6298 domain-containing protein [Opitutaceae bacterium]
MSALVFSSALSLRAEQRPPAVLQKGEGAALNYLTDAQGDRVPDFSSAGYGGGGVPLPQVPTRVTVTPAPGDATARVQAAIDEVAALPADARGFRGAVELAPGRYEFAGRLRIAASGVVLRGAGSGEGSDATVLVANGIDRRALILVRAPRDKTRTDSNGKSRRVSAEGERAITDERVAVGATDIHVSDTAGIAVGTCITILRPATKEWIHALGMDVAPGRQQFTWKPAAFTLRWTRTVVTVDGKKLTLDAPLTTALETRFGGGRVVLANAASTAEELTQVGVEHLRCESTFDAANPLDEQHAWDAIALDGVRDAWVADVTAVHFAGSAIYIGSDAQRVTVQDCASLAPVSEMGGYRRNTFHTDGQQTLFLRCRAEDGRNDFTVGYLAGGPNVFLECSALRSHGFSGSIGSWASGILFDNVTLDGGTLELNNRETWNQGVGWAAANSMLWQCSAPVVICRAPPTAMNWADGVWGQFVGDGRWSEVNEFIRPQSLYRAQLEARLGEKALAALNPRTSQPASESASNRASKSASNPVSKSASNSTFNLASNDQPFAQTLPASQRIPRSAGVPPASEKNDSRVAAAPRALALRNGWLTIGDVPLSGREAEISWWRGYLLENVEPTKPAITRFAPGLSGPIYTDDLDELTDAMKAAGQVLLRHHYGLWYDRRRMDHERMRRPDGDVWPPFYEQPFARSGQGTAWDGLSRYDLTKYNAWYFARLRQFAELAREKGLVLVNEMYFQHNILEAGAHWVDSPWRTVNNINNTGFTEPVPFTGDTMKMAAEFYDLSNPTRRALHRAYIRQCLSNLSDEPNVIHTLSAENSGPLSFMQFWIDVVAEWERETGAHPLIALSASKDVQDAILADPARAATIDVIDLTYWFRTPAGKLFAPGGGTDLAPRQHLRLWKGGRPSAASIAAMAKEYRKKFPGKAVITGLPEAGSVQP